MLLYAAPIGTLRCDRNARLSFVYAEKARLARDATPLSLSLPLLRREHAHDPVDAFLWGLLPDNEHVLERWGREFHVSARNPFALLAHVGEDCAGAVQIVPNERVAEIEGPGTPRIEWLTEAEVADGLRRLRHDETAWHHAGDEGRFSLAGAQPKIALFRDNDHWGIPVGRTPTTHIIKPPAGAFDGQVENEHFCLQLARRLGLPVASTEIVHFGQETAIVVERYDRARMTSGMAASMAAAAAAEAAAEAASGSASRAAAAAARAAALADMAKQRPVLRLHQEDMCQALAVRPESKYENEGGPSPGQIATLLRDHSDRPRDDLETFHHALLFNWLIGGSDAHAKNYSLLHGRSGRVRLAPLYDIASALPYPTLNTPRLKLAMRYGGQYRLQRIGGQELRKLVEELGLDQERSLDRSREICRELPAAARRVNDECKRQGLNHAVLDRLVELLTERAAHCMAQLGP